MTKRASEDILGALHAAVAETLLAKIQLGEATPAEINAAIKFLQNNGIEAVLQEGDTLDKLSRALPQFKDDDEEYIN